jgi:MarR family transcriptional regulator for hemolysin
MFENTLGMKLRGAYLAMHRAFQAHFAQLTRVGRCGVTADQFVVLSLLADEDGLIQRELVRRTRSDANTMTALLRLLERDGLIRRVRHQNDGRARCVFLTERGRQLQRRLKRSSAPLHQKLQTAVAADDLPALLRSLEQIATAMGELRQPQGESGRTWSNAGE